MATLAPAAELRRGNWARVVALQPVLFPLASLLVALTLLGAGPRLLIVVALPALAIGAISHRLSRPSAAGVALLLGVLALGAGLIARSNLLIVAGVLYLLAAISRGWGVNRAGSEVAVPREQARPRQGTRPLLFTLTTRVARRSVVREHWPSQGFGLSGPCGAVVSGCLGFAGWDKTTVKQELKR